MTIAEVIIMLGINLAFYCIGVIVGIEKEKKHNVKDYRKY